MKKLVFVFCIFLTGCTSKMICSNITESDSLKISENIFINYSGNNVVSIDDRIVYEVGDDILKQNFISIFNGIMSNYDRESISYKYEIGADIYRLYIKYYPKKLSDETLNSLNVSRNIKSYSASLVKQGYVCK